MVVGHGVGLTVAGLLIEQLGFEEVGHLRSACLIEVTVQAEVLVGLLDAALGDVELLSGFLDVVVGFLHADAQQLGVVGELCLCLLVLDLLALDGVRASPPVADGHADGGEDHAEGVVVVEQVMIVVACAHADGGQVLAYLHLMLQACGAHLLREQLVLGCRLHVEGASLQLVCPFIGWCHEGEDGIAETAVLGDEELNDGGGIAQGELLTGDIVLAQLYLQEVVAHGDACLQGDIDILGDISEQRLDGLDGLHLLLKGHELPEVLLGGLLDLVLGELQLQTADVLAHLCQAVAVDDLSSSEDGLHSSDTADGTILHHRDVDGVAQVGKHLWRHLLRHRLSQRLRQQLRGIDGGLSHALVGIEPEACGADIGEILGEGLAALLLGGADVETCLSDGKIVVEG